MIVNLKINIKGVLRNQMFNELISFIGLRMRLEGCEFMSRVQLCGEMVQTRVLTISNLEHSLEVS